MYLDFEDHRPDTPRVPTAISVREGILMSIIFHLGLVILLLVTPAGFFATEVDQTMVPVPQPKDPVQFVYMEPLVERPAPPRPTAEASDQDRRASSPERPPQPQTVEPFSRGNTPEKTVSVPDERMVGPDAPVPAAPTPAQPTPPPPDPSAVLLPDLAPRPTQLAGGRLGESLRDLQQYLRNDNFDNQRGGLAENRPDIQFDSRGVEFGPWIRRFVAQIKSNWNIPQAAMVNSGHVVLQFNVHKNGTISDIRIVEASRIEGFNVAAMNAVRQSNPTLPLPPEYPLPAALFTVTFRYNEGGLPTP
jgi:TonB family protein